MRDFDILITTSMKRKSVRIHTYAYYLVLAYIYEENGSGSIGGSIRQSPADWCNRRVQRDVDPTDE